MVVYRTLGSVMEFECVILYGVQTSCHMYLTYTVGTWEDIAAKAPDLETSANAWRQETLLSSILKLYLSIYRAMMYVF